MPCHGSVSRFFETALNLLLPVSLLRTATTNSHPSHVIQVEGDKYEQWACNIHLASGQRLVIPNTKPWYRIYILRWRGFILDHHFPHLLPNEQNESVWKVQHCASPVRLPTILVWVTAMSHMCMDTFICTLHKTHIMTHIIGTCQYNHQILKCKTLSNIFFSASSGSLNI